MNEEYDTTSVIDALQHVRKFSGKTIMIKLGGSILHNEALIKTLCEDLSLLKATGMKIVIVHGGSKAINIALNQYNINTEFLDGLRVTTKEAMEIIEMVLCGQINKQLVRKLNALGVQAAGLSGADNNMLLCDYYSDKHGYVGAIKKINLSLIKHFVNSQETVCGSIPIVSPVGVDDSGNALNINADCVASAIAVSLGVQKLIYLTDQDGIKSHDGNVISELYTDELEDMIKTGVVKDGMLTKANTTLSAIRGGISDIHIINGSTPHSLLTELFTTQGIGTVCKKTLQQSSEQHNDIIEEIYI